MIQELWLALVAFLIQSPASVPKTDSKPTETATAPTEKLLSVKRIYVDTFGEDAVAKQIQAMVINSLSESKRFLVTENKERADAVLKGRTLEQSHQEIHSSSEATATRRAAVEDSSTSTETINEARLAVRLVAADGDVIWTTTQESKGAKYKGAGADVADKVVKRLLGDLEKLEKKGNSPTSSEKKPP